MSKARVESDDDQGAPSELDVNFLKEQVCIHPWNAAAE